MTKHTIASAALKSILGVTKVAYSKSPRDKGGINTFHALKTPNVEGTADKIQDAMFGKGVEGEEGSIAPNPAIEGWTLFVSKDGSTAGLKCIAPTE